MGRHPSKYFSSSKGLAAISRPSRTACRNCPVLLFVEGAVQVVPLALVVPGSPEYLRKIDRRGVDDGRDGVVEVEGILADETGDRSGKGIRGQRACGDDDVRLRGDLRALFPDEMQAAPGEEHLLDCGGEEQAVNGQGFAGGHCRGIGCRHDEGVEPAHLLLEKAHGARWLIGSQRIAADKLGKLRRAVGRRELRRFHLPELDLVAALRELPGRLAAGKPAADDDDGFIQEMASLNVHPSFGQAFMRPVLRLYFSTRNFEPHWGHSSAIGRSQMAYLHEGYLEHP